MKALVVEDFKKAPRWSEFTNPGTGEGEVLVRVTAAARSRRRDQQA